MIITSLFHESGRYKNEPKHPNFASAPTDRTPLQRCWICCTI